MFEFAHLAGFFAAHGIWSVSDGGPLIPILGTERPNGDRGLVRFPTDDLTQAARIAQETLEANPDGAQRAVLVLDGYVTLEAGKLDALIIDAVEYGPAQQSFRMAVPYRPVESPAGFAVHRPKFLEISGVEPAHHSGLGQAFSAGVDAHEEAAAVWDAHLDDSI